MIWQALTSIRDLTRLYEIASVLVRHGFGDLVRRIGLAGALEKAGRALRWQDAHAYAHLEPPARVRRCLEELGPAFVKLGQVLATRVDLFEPEWIAEFGRLHDHAAPVAYAAVREQLAEDLGASPEEFFAEFDAEPIAAASLAQVYRASLRDGTPVAVKVRRPGIRAVVEADLRLLMRLAQAAEAESPELRVFRPRQVVREFARSLRRELDFAAEARNARRVAENFARYVDEDATAAAAAAAAPEPEPVIVIPRMHLASERVCVQDLVLGIPGSRIGCLEEAGLDRRLLARRGARAVLKMILEDGLFHADPHPGNVFYLDGNRIAFIDFGMVGRLTPQRREELMRLLFGLVNHRPRSTADVLLDWAGADAARHEDLLRDLEAFVDSYHDVPLGELHLGEALGEALALLREHRLPLPPELSLLVKAFISLEAMGRELDAGFQMAAQARPVLEAVMRRHFAAGAVLDRSWSSLQETLSLLAGLPADFSRLIRAARRGGLQPRIEIQHLERVGNQLDQAASRLTVGLVVSALIVGSSIVMTVPGGPLLLGLPVFGTLGFLGAVAGSFWLLRAISRSGA